MQFVLAPVRAVWGGIGQARTVLGGWGSQELGHLVVGTHSEECMARGLYTVQIQSSCVQTQAGPLPSCCTIDALQCNL